MKILHVVRVTDSLKSPFRSIIVLHNIRRAIVYFQNNADEKIIYILHFFYKHKGKKQKLKKAVLFDNICCVRVKEKDASIPVPRDIFVFLVFREIIPEEIKGILQ